MRRKERKQPGSSGAGTRLARRAGRWLSRGAERPGSRAPRRSKSPRAGGRGKGRDGPCPSISASPGQDVGTAGYLLTLRPPRGLLVLNSGLPTSGKEPSLSGPSTHRGAGGCELRRSSAPACAPHGADTPSRRGGGWLAAPPCPARAGAPRALCSPSPPHAPRSPRLPRPGVEASHFPGQAPAAVAALRGLPGPQWGGEERPARPACIPIPHPGPAAPGAAAARIGCAPRRP